MQLDVLQCKTGWCKPENDRKEVKHEPAPKNRRMIHDGSPEKAKTSGLFSFER